MRPLPTPEMHSLYNAHALKGQAYRSKPARRYETLQAVPAAESDRRQGGRGRGAANVAGVAGVAVPNRPENQVKKELNVAACSLLTRDRWRRRKGVAEWDSDAPTTRPTCLQSTHAIRFDMLGGCAWRVCWEGVLGGCDRGAEKAS